MWRVHNRFVRDGCELSQAANRKAKLCSSLVGRLLFSPACPVVDAEALVLQFVDKLYFVQALWAGSMKRLNLAIAQHLSSTRMSRASQPHCMIVNVIFFSAEPSCEALSPWSPCPRLPLRASISSHQRRAFRGATTGSLLLVSSSCWTAIGLMWRRAAPSSSRL